MVSIEWLFGHGKIDHRGTGLTKTEQEKKMLSCISRDIDDIELELPEF